MVGHRAANGTGWSGRRPRRLTAGLLAAALAGALSLAGCGPAATDRADQPGGSTGASSPQAPGSDGPAGDGRPIAGSTGSGPVAGPGALTADDVKQAPALPPAADLGELAEARAEADVQPLSLSIERIGLDDVAVQAVGVEPTGEMSIPPPKEVGWYRYGPLPGGAGSAVLAGHIASSGIDGAFRHLDRLAPGDAVEVALSDGQRLRFVVTDTVQVSKTDLPFDQLFARSGPPKLALITCGGEFDYSARSYRDNVVVVAELAP